jgi:hypothetical protein
MQTGTIANCRVMARKNFTVCDDYGVLATFWTAQCARAAALEWTHTRVYDNRTGELLVVRHPEKALAR